MRLTDKEKGIYLLWLAINIVILFVFGTIGFDRDFYPFEGLENIKDYDLSEFIVYTSVPFLLLLAVKYLKIE